MPRRYANGIQARKRNDGRSVYFADWDREREKKDKRNGMCVMFTDVKGAFDKVKREE